MTLGEEGRVAIDASTVVFLGEIPELSHIVLEETSYERRWSTAAGS
jgi:hypothetical protein